MPDSSIIIPAGLPPFETVVASTSPSLVTTWSNIDNSDISLKFSNLTFSASSPKLLLQATTDGGSTWKTAGTDYEYGVGGGRSLASTYDGANGQTAANILLFASSFSNVAGTMANGTIFIPDPSNDSLPQSFYWVGGGRNGNNPFTLATVGGGSYRANTPINGVRLIADSGNIVAGELKSYRVL